MDPIMTDQPKIDTSRVTRIEIIDQNGRQFVTHGAENVTLALQDDGRTLKVFCEIFEDDFRRAWLSMSDDAQAKVDQAIDAIKRHGDRTDELLQRTAALTRSGEYGEAGDDDAGYDLGPF